MKNIFILLTLFTNILFSQYQLSTDYIFHNNTITGKDIFPEITQDIFIYKVPKRRGTFSINSNEIISKFKNYGIKVEKKGVRRVKFVRISPEACLECIEDYIADEFQNFYTYFDIEKVSIYPKTEMKNFPEDYSIVFKGSNLRRASGFFYIEDDRRKKFHFKYNLKAFLTVIKTSERVKRGQIIDHENTYSKTVEFKRFKNSYVTENQLGRIVAKSYIPKDRELTERQIEKIKLVKRNQYIKGFLKDGVVYIEVEVKALQSGGIDDIIRIETPEGIKLRAKIINNQLVNIL